MGFFELISKFTTPLKKNKLAEGTGGIFSDNSLLIDQNTGKVRARINIPIIDSSPSPSEKWTKDQAFLSGALRQASTNPANPEEYASKLGNNDPSMSQVGQDDLQAKDYQNGSEALEKASYNDPNDTQNLHENIYGSDSRSAYKSMPLASGTNPAVIPENDPASAGVTDPINDPDGRQALREQFPQSLTSDNLAKYKDKSFMPTDGSSQATLFDRLKGDSGVIGKRNPLDNLVAGVTAQDPVTGKTITETDGVDARKPEYEQRLDPNLKDETGTKGAKNSKKWKDILVSVLQNISQTDFSKYSPDQQLGALIGAAGGGAVRGAVTGRYAGKLDVANKNRKIDQRNSEARERYESDLGLEGKRANVALAKQQPELREAKAELARVTQKSNEAYRQGQLTAKQRDQDIKLATVGLNRERFEQSTKGYANPKVVKNPEGDGYILVGQKKETGKYEPIRYEDGTVIEGSNPDIWKGIMANLAGAKLEADVVGDVAASSVRPPSDAEINAKAKAIADAEIAKLPVGSDGKPKRADVVNVQEKARAEARKALNDAYEDRKKKAGSRAKKRVIVPAVRKASSGVRTPATANPYNNESAWRSRRNQ